MIIIVYGGFVTLSILILVNIAPFAHQISKTFYLSILVIFVITLTYALTAFPFTQEAPLKLFFQQSVEVGAANTSSVIRAETLLTGIPGYIDRRIVRELPSSWGKNITCETDMILRPGLLTCKWDSGLLLPSPGITSNNSEIPWLKFHAERLNTSAGRISIKGTNTRSCILYFDNPISSFTVSGAGRHQPGYEIPEGGTQTIYMWSRTWEKEFNVEFSWAGAGEDFEMEGRAACEWAEYASGTAGSPKARLSAQIPALEEVLHYLPLWATPTKWTIGLVEAWTKFSL